MATAVIGLGSNLGDRRLALASALSAIDRRSDVRLLAASSLYESTPAGGPAGQAKFLNAAALVETSRSPEQLLADLLAAEHELGRRRTVRWDARPIDLDLLLYDDIVVDSPALTLPHPRMAFRRFVLEPAAVVAPKMLHPTSGWTIRALRDHLETADHYVAIGGAPGTASEALAIGVSEQNGCPNVAARLGNVGISSGDQKRPLYFRPPETVFEAVDRSFLATRRSHWTGDDVLRIRVGPGRHKDCVPAISDFWLAEIPSILAVAAPELYGPGAETSSCEYRPPGAESQVAPKLVVFPNMSDAASWASFERNAPRLWRSALVKRGFFRLCQALRVHALQPGHGPVLFLDLLPMHVMVEEISAAIEAMRPVRAAGTL